jgi:hypothetical protein
MFSFVAESMERSTMYLPLFSNLVSNAEARKEEPLTEKQITSEKR